MNKTSFLSDPVTHANLFGQIEQIDIRELSSFSEWEYSFDFLRKQYIQFQKFSMDTVPSSVSIPAKIFRKDMQNWLMCDHNDVFTWSDYVRCYSTLQNKKEKSEEEKKYLDGWNFIQSVCLYYYTSNNLQAVEKSFEHFMSHPPLDYSRPHGWYSHPEYISFSELLESLDAFDKNIISEDQKNKICDEFQATFPGFSTIRSHTDTLIPYDVYAENWDQLQDYKTTKPWNIEICFYYVQQRRLGIAFVQKSKAQPSQKLPFQGEIAHKLHLKWCSIYDFLRMVQSWDTLINILDGTMFTKFEPNLFEHCTNLNFTSTKDHRIMAVTKKAGCSYRQVVEQYLSYFGDEINCIIYGLLLNHYLESIPVAWKTTTLDQPIHQKTMIAILAFLLNQVASELKSVQALVTRLRQEGKPLVSPLSWILPENFEAKYPDAISGFSSFFNFPDALEELQETFLPEKKIFEIPVKANKILSLKKNSELLQNATKNSAFSTFAKQKDLSDIILTTYELQDLTGISAQNIWLELPDLPKDKKIELDKLLVNASLKAEKIESNQSILKMLELVEKFSQQDKDLKFLGTKRSQWPRIMRKELNASQ